MANTPTGRVTPAILWNAITPGAVLLSATAPALLGLLLAWEAGGPLPPFMAFALVAIPTLMNASVDLLNDYFDYVRGNDTPDNVVSEDDGPLAFHRVADPRPVLWAGLALLLPAVALGVYVALHSGPLPVLIALVGLVMLLTYSGGSRPLSHLPIGEVTAGLTLGGLIPLGVYAALTGELNWLVLYKSLPMVLIVSQFMLVNNTCDMERDAAVGRRTLPILIGRNAAEHLAHILSVVWGLQMLHVVAAWYLRGLPILLLTLLAGTRAERDIFRQPRTHENKIPATAAMAGAALAVALGYPLALLIHLMIT